jgi:CRP-like cAMP-binding protein
MRDEYHNKLRREFERYGSISGSSGDALCSIFSEESLYKDEYFTLGSDSRLKIGFIVHGIVRLFYLSADGHEHNKHFFMENDFFQSRLEPDSTFVLNIQALQNSLLLTAEYTEFLELCRQYTDIDNNYKKILLSYMEKKQEREVRLLSLDAAGKYSLFHKEYGVLLENIPHYHIASYLGITPTQLSRVRAKTR